MSTRSAERMRRHRALYRNGRISLRVAVDEAHLVDVLVHSGRLLPAMTDNRESIRTALEELIASMKVSDRERL